MVALRIANVPRLPVLLMIVDCANALAPAETTKSSVNSAALRIRLLLRVAGLGRARLRVAGFGFAGLRLAGLRLAGLLLLRVGVVLLEAIFLLFAEGLTLLEIAGAVEVDLPLDEFDVDARVCGELVTVPDGGIGILPHLDRTDAVLEAKLPGRIDRTELQRFLFREPAVLHGLARVEIEVTRELVRVGVDAGQHAVPNHQRDVVRRRVIRLGLVTPPVDERARARAVLADLLRNLVA